MVVRETAIVALTDGAKSAVDAANVSSHARGRTTLHACGARRDRGCVRNQVGEVLQQAMARSQRRRGATVPGQFQTSIRVTERRMDHIRSVVYNVASSEDGRHG